MPFSAAQLIHEFERGELDRAALERSFGKAAVAVCVRTIRYKIIALSRRTRQRRAPAQVDAVEAP